MFKISPKHAIKGGLQNVSFKVKNMILITKLIHVLSAYRTEFVVNSVKYNVKYTDLMMLKVK